MHSEEIMKPDLLSEIVLTTFGTLTLSFLVLFAMAAFAHLDRLTDLRLRQIYGSYCTSRNDLDR